MNKVITINLNGNAYQLEEAAYERLHSYLEGAERQLAANPDRAEIVADIEQAIADKCRAALGNFRTVVSFSQIDTILSEMGPVVDGSAGTGSPAPSAAATGSSATRDAAAGSSGPGGFTSAAAAAASASAESGPEKRLYRLPEGAMFGGVCNGLAAFTGVPVNLIRFGFILTTLLWGFGLLVYLVMLAVVPSARTSAEQAAAFGSPNTAAEFVRRAREGYYDGMKNWQDRASRREWKRKFKDEMRTWRDQVRAEMRAGNYHKAWQWNCPQAPLAPPPPAGLFILWPVFALIKAVLTLAFLSVLFSLVFTGSIFGVALPWGLPMWMGIVFAALIYNALVWPFRWRRWCYGHGYHGGGAIFWLLLFVFFVWFSQSHHHGNLHEFGHELAAFFRDLANSIRDWWQGK